MDFLIIKSILFKGVAGVILFDFMTGILAAKKNREVKSKVCANGLFQTMGECIYLSLLLFIGKIFPSINAILIVLLIAFILKECISIAENLHKLNVWIPKWIKECLEICVEKIDSIDIKEKMEDKK